MHEKFVIIRKNGETVLFMRWSNFMVESAAIMSEQKDFDSAYYWGQYAMSNGIVCW